VGVQTPMHQTYRVDVNYPNFGYFYAFEFERVTTKVVVHSHHAKAMTIHGVVM
jgi:hypothetical protein